MSQQAPRQFLVYGNTMAASMTVLALSKVLPKNIGLTWLKPVCECHSDMLYGGISSPDAYQFNLQYGVTEPELILETDTTFSFGTHYRHWGEQALEWMQCFHLPFTATLGVDFHHLITKHNSTLNDYLISAQAALKGAFAHPPEDKPQSALSRAEYGYQFDPQQWSRVFSTKIDTDRVKVINGEIDTINHNDDQIDFIQLKDGTKLQASLNIDCSGVKGELISRLDNVLEAQRTVHLDIDTELCNATGPACRSINGTGYGWRSVTSLRNKNTITSLYEASFRDEQEACQTFELGYRHKAWQGNCLGIGHSVYALEPVSTAPYILLTRDIKRLLELIPVNENTEIERREYNQRFQNDVSHAELFHRALYFEQREVGYGVCDKLERKLNQYSHRGILTKYDFEPFNEQDWVILHEGMGRTPKQFDRMAEQVSYEKMQTQLDAMRAGIAQLSSSMPPHHIYLQKLSEYLRNNQKRG